MRDHAHPILLGGKPLVPGSGPFIFGILNVTPDSFSDAGRFMTPAAAVDAGCRMADEGADAIDVGGESTRPGSTFVSPDEQIRRTGPVIEELTRRLTGTDAPAISIDTRLASVARAALDAGATIVNDISALHDPEMGPLIAARGAGVILMHMKGTPANMQADPIYVDVVEEIRSFLQQRMATALAAGIPADRIILDPGIGFGKTTSHNLMIIRNLHRFVDLGAPTLVGPSRKRFIGEVLRLPSPTDRLHGTLATVAACVLAGVECVRVHDVAAARQVADLSAAIHRAGASLHSSKTQV
ncbi:MAG TPA: dihydropteroate synthase [Phycisphaerae bacterium]|nr:dihydropteroate synthase [Phycisphaerae bacterium]HRY68258.1 dihydropteroate synthase [Phycisphaerae bacterium]HSA29941.1 dihydropteroate synthase [Phycisphaerae bacterium]